MAEARRNPGRVPAIILAVLVHVAFIGVLVFGVDWQNHEPAPVVAELWNSLPKAETAPPPPPPPPEPEAPKPDPPNPEPNPNPTRAGHPGGYALKKAGRKSARKKKAQGKTPRAQVGRRSERNSAKNSAKDEQEFRERRAKPGRTKTC
jgi:colicin import membrane protein